MRNRIGRLVAAVIAAVLTLLAAPVVEAIALAPADSHSTYVYDNHHHPALVTGVVTERGPSATHDSTTTDDGGLRSLGDLARSNGPTTPATYDYNDLGQLAQSARGCRLAEERAGGGPAAIAVVQRSGVAAKSTPELASGLERTGTALSKSDPFHRSVSWVVDNPAAQWFAIKGGDGVSRELYQLPGEVNGKSGVFEWIIDRSGTNPVINHQRFIPGGSITGVPNQVVP